VSAKTGKEKSDFEFALGTYGSLPLDKLQDMLLKLQDKDTALAKQAATKGGGPDSPRKGGAIKVLCWFKDGVYHPTATAIVVTSTSKTILLTACHAIGDMEKNSEGHLTGRIFEYPDLCVADKIDKTSGRVEAINAISVQRIAFDVISDIAMLKSSSPFSETIDLCPINELPRTVTEDKAKLYFCSIQLFYEIDMPILESTSDEYHRVAGRSGHHILMKGGQLSGSSGGALVDSNGRLVGIHNSSWRPTMIRNPGAPVTNSPELNLVWDRISSLAGSYVNYSVSTIPQVAAPHIFEFLAQN